MSSMSEWNRKNSSVVKQQNEVVCLFGFFKEKVIWLIFVKSEVVTSKTLKEEQTTPSY